MCIDIDIYIYILIYLFTSPKNLHRGRNLLVSPLALASASVAETSTPGEHYQQFLCRSP